MHNLTVGNKQACGVKKKPNNVRFFLKTIYGILCPMTNVADFWRFEPMMIDILKPMIHYLEYRIVQEGPQYKIFFS